jgi:hypothetical protein
MTELRNSNKTIFFRTSCGNRHAVSLERLFFENALEQCRSFHEGVAAGIFMFCGEGAYGMPSAYDAAAWQLRLMSAASPRRL